MTVLEETMEGVGAVPIGGHRVLCTEGVEQVLIMGVFAALSMTSTMALMKGEGVPSMIGTAGWVLSVLQFSLGSVYVFFDFIAIVAGILFLFLNFFEQQVACSEVKNLKGMKMSEGGKT